jgi:hypothetical protein
MDMALRPFGSELISQEYSGEAYNVTEIKIY